MKINKKRRLRKARKLNSIPKGVLLDFNTEEADRYGKNHVERLNSCSGLKKGFIITNGEITHFDFSNAEPVEFTPCDMILSFNPCKLIYNEQ